MIKNLEIKNFKSIKNLNLECKRINVFIGKPNTGKSNILEALGILSFGRFCIIGADLKEFVRFEYMNNLFYNENLDESITIKTDGKTLEIGFDSEKEIFWGRYRKETYPMPVPQEVLFSFEYDYTHKRGCSCPDPTKLPFKFYRFSVRKEFPRKEVAFLLPPSGDNLLALLRSHKELRKFVKDIFHEYGLRVVLKPQENKMEVQKEIEDIIISHPYPLVSDTLQRLIFYLAAIETNKDSVIVFEEPEAHAFPYYTKYLAERIALDKSNQYFISTHNPYLLLSILEKAPQNDIGIFITYFEDYQTKVKPLSEKQKEEILGEEIDIFFNIDNIERFVSE